MDHMLLSPEPAAGFGASAHCSPAVCASRYAFVCPHAAAPPGIDTSATICSNCNVSCSSSETLQSFLLGVTISSTIAAARPEVTTKIADDSTASALRVGLASGPRSSPVFVACLAAARACREQCDEAAPRWRLVVPPRCPPCCCATGWTCAAASTRPTLRSDLSGRGAGCWAQHLLDGRLLHCRACLTGGSPGRPQQDAGRLQNRSAARRLLGGRRGARGFGGLVNQPPPPQLGHHGGPEEGPFVMGATGGCRWLAFARAAAPPRGPDQRGPARRRRRFREAAGQFRHVGAGREEQPAAPCCACTLKVVCAQPRHWASKRPAEHVAAEACQQPHTEGRGSFSRGVS